MEDKKIKVLEELAKQSDEEYMKILKNKKNHIISKFFPVCPKGAKYLFFSERYDIIFIGKIGEII